MVVSSASSWSHLAKDSVADARLSDHLVEQPKTLVVGTVTGLPAEQFVEGVLGVVRRGWLDVVVVDPSDVAEFAIGIEDVDMWGRADSVGSGSLLGLAIVEIGKRKSLSSARIFMSANESFRSE